ncbi:MAG: cobalamin-dependent protein [Verrucomicrobiales bacterium]
MKICLIAMSGVRVVNPELRALGLTLPGFIERGKVIASLPSLGLLTLAGMTPACHEVIYREIDELSADSSDIDCDLVAISSLTARIDDAYVLANAFRSRGVLVVIGGIHASVLPQEALEHCDAVVAGNAEGIWPKILEDAASARLRGIYRSKVTQPFTSAHYVMPAFHLMAGRRYNRVTVQTARGCPRACEFCGASRLISAKFQQKPVSRVIAEIGEARKWIDRPFFEFADDNTFLDRGYGRELVKTLIPLGIRWFTETDVSIADDLELCNMLAESGCRQLLIGFESPHTGDLKTVDPGGWKHRMGDRYLRAIDVLQSRGVSVNGCFIFGLDDQDTGIFPAVVDFVRQLALPSPVHRPNTLPGNRTLPPAQSGTTPAATKILGPLHLVRCQFLSCGNVRG